MLIVTTWMVPRLVGYIHPSRLRFLYMHVCTRVPRSSWPRSPPPGFPLKSNEPSFSGLCICTRIQPPSGPISSPLRFRKSSFLERAHVFLPFVLPLAPSFLPFFLPLPSFLPFCSLPPLPKAALVRNTRRSSRYIPPQKRHNLPIVGTMRWGFFSSKPEPARSERMFPASLRLGAHFGRA